jgi:hypothetical protein
VEAGRGDAEDVQTAFESLRDIHDYVVTDRAPP